MDIEQFRSETRTWLEANCPEEMRTPGSGEADMVWGGRDAKFPNPAAEQWLRAMAGRGWTAPTWPTEYGGGGLSPDENLVLQSELRRIKARPPLVGMGLSMLGPVLLEFAGDAQRTEHLPKIINGDIRWCQGYSEPGAGSDLASLATKCEDRGDHWLVNGQKVWTSYADQCDWIFALVRTGPSEPKHQGISFVLIDMASEGVSTKPITLISGASPFCETFFDNVRVPKQNLIGELNKGWTIAKRLLEHERTMLSAMGGGARAGGFDIVDVARRHIGTDASGQLRNRTARGELTRWLIDSRAFALTLRRWREESKAEGPSPTASMFKLYASELNKRRYELMLQLYGNEMLGWEGEGFDEANLRHTRAWLRSKANSIEGGTSEVQLNVIAKRVLKLGVE